MADEWLRVARLADLRVGEVRQVEVGGQPIALYNVGGAIYATDDRCTHARALMSEGHLEGDRIECPMHQAVFHVPTGKVLKGPARVDLGTHETAISGEDVLVRLRRS